MSPKRRVVIALLPLLVGFDFWTKEAARALPIGERVTLVDGLLDLTHAENPFIAFSVPVPMTLILAFGVLAMAVLAHQLYIAPPEARLRSAGLAAMLAGAFGNLADRLADGTVTDMFSVYTHHASAAPWLRSTFGTSAWPIFNVADAALLAGVGLTLLATATEPEDHGRLTEA